MMTGQIIRLEDIRKFITAGNATFTLVSKKTGSRRTFKVEQTNERVGSGFFVRLLTGPENTSSYHYLGFMYENSAGELRIKKNKDNWGAESFGIFCWLLSMINQSFDTLEKVAEFWHEGRCGRCGRILTVPESIASGIGPICAGMES